MNAIPGATSSWSEVLLNCGDADEAAAICHAHGASLIETLTEQRIRVFIEGEVTEFLARLPESLTVVSVTAVENKNWHESCAELWAPKLIGRVTITPVTGIENAPTRRENELLIIPGTGFGTGHHPATAMLIERLQGIKPAPQTALDLGCGSGILAFVARILWPQSRIDAIDNDPLALENAADNAAINGITDVPLICGTLDAAPLKHYELIIANLYSSLHLQLQGEMQTRCTRLILSGVMESEEQMLLAGFKNWRLVSSNIVDGWLSAEFASTQ